jgi:4-hydroxy-tetrahydrodipicolinate reductase
MKAALIGYGQMGRLIEKRLVEQGHDVLIIVDPFYSQAGKPPASGAEVYTALEDANLNNVDVAIEFTLPGNAPGNIIFLANKKIPVVTGTTGWHAKLPEVSKAVDAAGSALLWSSNFSLGVNLFYRVAACAAKLIDPFADYDVAGFEVHHNKKADSPSGTAKTLVEKVLAQMTRKQKAVYSILDRKPDADELHFASLRVGSVPGTHSLIFDSQADAIEITHTARSREGFAAGAVLAAQWLVDKKPTGVFTVDDVLADILPKN